MDTLEKIGAAIIIYGIIGVIIIIVSNLILKANGETMGIDLAISGISVVGIIAGAFVLKFFYRNFW